MESTSQDRLFISYSSRDAQAVQAIIEHLNSRGIRIWLDQNEIAAGDLLMDRIDVGLREAKYFVLFWSRAYQSGSWTQAEARAAFDLVMEAGERRIIIVQLDDAEIPPLLRPSRRIGGSGPEMIASEIIRAVERADLTMPEASVSAVTSDRVIEWADVQDAILPSLVRRLLAATAELLAQPGPIARFEVKIASQRVLRLEVIRAMLEDSAIRADLEADIEILGNNERYSSELRKTMARESLGTLQPGFIIALENKQREIQQTRGRIRAALSSLTETLIACTIARH